MFRTVVGTVLRAAFIGALLAVAGCDDTPTAPTLPPEVPVITESFSGTVTVNGAVTHPFVVGTPGPITAQLLNVSTGTETVVGFSLGTFNTQTDACTAVISNDNAVQGRVLIGSATSSGAFCVRVYDVGQLTAPASYEITLTHQ